jgi:aspartate aminotransferase
VRACGDSSDVLFGSIKVAPPDPILGTTLAFNADGDAKKINLGVGAYRTEEGKPFVLDVIRQAEEELLAELGTGNNKEYSTIDGPPDLKKFTQELCFGAASGAVRDGRIASVQALSGTGALRVCAEFMKKHLPQAQDIYVSDPTWGNHNAIFAKAGLTVKSYPYYDASTNGFNFAGMMGTLGSAAAGSVILLHACAHNPTGVDPTEDQWRQIVTVMKEKQLIPLMDSAYQGYASGSLEKDAFAMRLFESEGLEFFLCQSFAKNLGLYGERIGMLHVICESADNAKAVLSQLKLVVRPMYSSPPIHGALLVMKILGNEARFEAWKRELAAMANRILEVRAVLRKGLEDKGTPGTWNHITDQIGMFSYTGLSAPMCERLISQHHIYLLKSGRISLAGLNKGNTQYMIDCVDEAVRACPR